MYIAILLIAAILSGQADTSNTSLTLKVLNRLPSRIQTQITGDFSPTKIIADDAGRTLTIVGRSAEVIQAGKIVQMLDVSARSLRLEMRLIRCHYNMHGTLLREDIIGATALIVNNEPYKATFTVNEPDGTQATYTLDIFPRLNGDETLSLVGNARIQQESPKISLETRFQRILFSNQQKGWVFSDPNDQLAQSLAETLPQPASTGSSRFWLLEICYLKSTARPKK